ncbi:hypothetical protein L917_06291 [Phytophthora nicotianae]|uniref:Uncharacterized protein n=1 Tax=Phytophthora nicotianae TaxID=4792 RepID=W2H2L9_PHYNI|nr:hypothetical protein L915_06481 [Phytophthora nicotianae]ETL96054.1 hypothetical protein L917_06291 [Phytophthora nicotianae]
MWATQFDNLRRAKELTGINWNAIIDISTEYY